MNIIDFKRSCINSAAARLRHSVVGIAVFLVSFAVCQVQAAAPSQTPLFLSVGAKPHIALVMSVDHELFKKAYTDYANLDGAKLEMKDTTYRDDFDYYGYFDSDWCYSYVEDAANQINSHFTPHSKAVAPTGSPVGTKAHQCIGGAVDTWSGNFLNWLSMSRMDIVRRVLFGGARAAGGDTASRTLLERAYLPKDVHAFAKVYGSSSVDIAPYTPSSFVTGNTYSFCNVSTSEDVATGYPLIRAASGSWPLWATVESGYFGGNCSLATSGTLMPASVTKDYTAKVEACVTGKNATVTVGATEEAAPRCRKYGNNYKSSGLLQKYGETGQINFSLMSGSYKANHKGGVLRKAAGPLVSSPADASVDEINTSTGQFNDVPGIIRNISKFRISTYKFSTKIYDDCNSWSIPITDFVSSTNSGRRCRDWGNPLSEIYLETLRYIAGKVDPTDAFEVDDSTADGKYPGIAGLSKATWNDPWPTDQYCAKCSIIVLSTGSNSFDGDDLGGVTDLPGLTAALLGDKTDSVGTQEYGSFGAGKEFFMGGLDPKSRYCKSFSLTGLSSYKGICPELPALEGTYSIAGLAHYARTTDMRPTLSDGPGGIYKQKVNTYAVDLAETVPTIPLIVNGNTVRILPACESNISGGAVDETASDPWSTCSLFDVKIHSLTYSGNDLVAGSMSFYWEDSLWGYDYDLDVEQRLNFCVGPTASGCNDASVGASEIKIVNTIPYAEAGNALRLSYSIYGVSSFSGTWIRNSSTTTIPSTSFSGGLVSPWMLRPGGTNYANTIPANVGASTFKFVAATSSVELPKKPLFLAAKYGGFTDLKKNEVTNAVLADDTLDYVKEWDNYKGLQDTVPDNFFSVKNPALLEDSLDNIFTNILRKTSSASAVATSSTRLQEGQFVYQAIFDSSNWSGELRSFDITAAGTLAATPTVTTRSININTMTPAAASRKMFTYKSDDSFGVQNTNGTSRDTVVFNWANLHADQQAKLALTGDVSGTDQKRLGWLQGNKTDENTISGLRVRDYEDANGAAYRNIIGDIVNSSPAFVGSANYRHFGLPVNLGGNTYTDYLSWKKGGTLATYPTTPTSRIFVGSNDGMLHAFNAETLQELFAYVPNRTFHKLAKLTERDYGTNANMHQYFVDGPIVSGDVFISTPNDPVKKWRSIIVGTFGAGAKGIYALDVTKESDPEVLFEYAHADMGYVLGKPVIVPTAEDRWTVVVGNGVDSGGTGTSKLFVVDLELPYSKTRILDTGAGTGLSAPSVLTNAVGIATTIYAGDLSGNMRRFNVSDASATNWNSYRVYRARTAGSVNQPIVAAPTIGYNSKLGKNMVYFGTGKYHDDIDKNVGAIRHSIYAVPDMGPTGTAATRSNLLLKTMTTSYTSGSESRVISTANPDWTSKIGWYIDLDYSVAAKRDERVTIKPILIQDRLFITTLIPSDANCLPGGSSWFMEITAVGDGYKTGVPPIAVFSPELTLGDPGIGVLSPFTGGNASAGSVGSASSTASSADSCGNNVKALAIKSGTGGNVSANLFELKACMLGRQSWQQLK